MSRHKPRVCYQGAFYHIYNRGNNKQKIFLDEDDYVFYLKKLREFKKKHEVTIICYCLMPNHLHLAIGQNTKMPISKFILSLHTSYSMYFNRKYDKVGHLFQGRFGQKNITKNEYLLYLSSYIHLNPLIDGLAEKLEDYQWSSYPDYIDLRPGTLCDKELILLGNSPDWYRQITEEEMMDQLIKKEFQEELALKEFL